MWKKRNAPLKDPWKEWAELVYQQLKSFQEFNNSQAKINQGFAEIIDAILEYTKILEDKIRKLEENK